MIVWHCAQPFWACCRKCWQCKEAYCHCWLPPAPKMGREWCGWVEQSRGGMGEFLDREGVEKTQKERVRVGRGRSWCYQCAPDSNPVCCPLPSPSWNILVGGRPEGVLLPLNMPLRMAASVNLMTRSPTATMNEQIAMRREVELRSWDNIPGP